MVHFKLVLLCVYGTFAASYDIGQIRNLINSTLTCIEKTPLLNENATFQMATALSFTETAFNTVKNLRPETAEILHGIISRLEPFIDRSFAAYPDSLNRYLWHSKYWSTRCNVSFEVGKISQQPALDETLTLSQVLDRTIYTPEINSCFIDLMTDNPQSNDLRTCVLRCEDEMNDRNLQGGISPEARGYYPGVQLLSNCSNSSPTAYRDQIAYFCGYMKQEVNAMFKYRNQTQFDDSLFYFLNKVVFCSGWGFSEFFEEDIVAEVLEGIDCHGCVGASRGGDDQQVLTSQTLAILLNIQRMIIEKDERGQ